MQRSTSVGGSPSATVAQESAQYAPTRGTRSTRRSSPSRTRRSPGGPPTSAVRSPVTRSASRGTRPPAARSIAARVSAHSSSSLVPLRSATRAAACPASATAVDSRIASSSSGSLTARARRTSVPMSTISTSRRASAHTRVPWKRRKVGRHRGGRPERFEGEFGRGRRSVHVLEGKAGEHADVDVSRRARRLILAHDSEDRTVGIDDHERRRRERTWTRLDVRDDAREPRDGREVGTDERPSSRKLGGALAARRGHAEAA